MILSGILSPAPDVEPLRAAVAAVESRQGGRPPWEMSREEQRQLAGLAAE